jgi:hypothetical protein
MKREEAAKKPHNTDEGEGKTRSMSVARLILVNMLFFAVVAGGLLWVSGSSLTDLYHNSLAFWAAKSRDDDHL